MMMFIKLVSTDAVDWVGVLRCAPLVPVVLCLLDDVPYVSCGGRCGAPKHMVCETVCVWTREHANVGTGTCTCTILQRRAKDETTTIKQMQRFGFVRSNGYRQRTGDRPFGMYS